MCQNKLFSLSLLLYHTINSFSKTGIFGWENFIAKDEQKTENKIT